MIGYYKKAWKVAGTLQKYQYFRLISILWIIFWVFCIGTTIAATDLTGVPISEVIETIVEAIIIIPIIVVMIYVNIRFFPWAKTNLNPDKNISIIDNVKREAKREYQDTLNKGPQQYSEFDISSHTEMVDEPEDVPTNVPYSARQAIKAKYGSNYDVYRNNGSSPAAHNVSDQTRQAIKNNYGQLYDVYASRPSVKRPHTTYKLTRKYYQESYLDFKLRLKESQIAAAIQILVFRIILVPLINFMANFMIVWPFAFVIAPIKMRSVVKATFGESKK